MTGVATLSLQNKSSDSCQGHKSTVYTWKRHALNTYLLLTQTQNQKTSLNAQSSMKERHSPIQSWIPPTPLLAVLNFKRDDVSYTGRILTSLLKTSRSTHLPALPSCCASAGGRWPARPLCPRTHTPGRSGGTATAELLLHGSVTGTPHTHGLGKEVTRSGLPTPRALSPSSSRPAPCRRKSAAKQMLITLAAAHWE